VSVSSVTYVRSTPRGADTTRLAGSDFRVVCVRGRACAVDTGVPRNVTPDAPAFVAASTTDDPDQALLERLLAGEESAFETLVRQYHDRLVRLARVYVRTDAVAADVVQDTWLAVLRGLSQFERRSTLRTWIFHILANRARTRAVREGRFVPFADFDAARWSDLDGPDNARFDVSGRWAQPPAPWRSLDPERLMLNEEVQAALSTAIEALPAGQRAVIALRDIEGLSAEETCNVLDITETNQRVLLHRGRTRVRAALAGLLAGPR